MLIISDVTGAERDEISLYSKRGRVERQQDGQTEWMTARTRSVIPPRDRLRTLVGATAAIKLGAKATVRLGSSTVFLAVAPESASQGPGFRIELGEAEFQSRERPERIRFITPVVTGAIRGTEVYMRVAANGATEVVLIDGEVELSNPQGQLLITSGEAAEIQPGGPPVKTAVINVMNVLQWALYYPAVLDPDAFAFTPAETTALAASTAAYRTGDLPAAIEALPAGFVPQSPDAVSYRAMLLAMSGRIAEADAALVDVAGDSAAALRGLIAAVKAEDIDIGEIPMTASGWLARSYYLQSQRRLAEALNAARKATELKHDFGYAWARVAELEFSFGRAKPSRRALERARDLTSENAQAAALHGFVLAAAGRSYSEVLAAFDEAIELDSALANGWLGRGLLRIRNGKIEAGREDLQIAAIMEPNRAVIRSYLGKAWHSEEENELSRKEFDLARRIDPADPTASLYQALLNREENRINDAVRDLQESRDRNDNRALYRSRFLLDQDRAVRSSSLARVYDDAGLSDVAFREAVRAAQDDHANYSAHLFLADSFDLDFTQLRFETAQISEYLLANLLAPVSAGVLSRTISQQEYSRFFAEDGISLVTASDYQSCGRLNQRGAVYGSTRKFGYSVGSSYIFDPGQKEHGDLSFWQADAKVRLQISPTDSLYVETVMNTVRTGDLQRTYENAPGEPGLRVSEEQRPLLLAGWHREWNPSSQTLFLYGRIPSEQRIDHSAQPLTVLNTVFAPATVADTSGYEFDQEIHTLELQQILQGHRTLSILGGRYQTGDLTYGNTVPGAPGSRIAVADVFNENIDRLSAYAYEIYEATATLDVIAGASYDRLVYPRAHRLVPVLPGSAKTSRFSPKLGLIWQPLPQATIRAAYTKSLGGVSSESSIRLEPSVVGGFIQSFRSLVPDSAGFDPVAATFETWSTAVEVTPFPDTYLSVRAEILESQGQHLEPFYFSPGFGIPGAPIGLDARQDFREKLLNISLHHLMGDHWTVGTRLALADAELHFRRAGHVAAGLALADEVTASTLYETSLFAVINRPNGWFGRAEANWYVQSNRGYSPARPGDDFWQFNLHAGYRFARRRASVQLSLLNIADHDYRLSPLNLHADLPRERTLAASFRMNF